MGYPQGKLSRVLSSYYAQASTVVKHRVQVTRFNLLPAVLPVVSVSSTAMRWVYIQPIEDAPGVDNLAPKG